MVSDISLTCGVLFMRVRFYRLAFFLLVASYISVVAYGQGVVFTGFVDQDFQGATFIADDQGVDVAMIGGLANNTSGWDMMGLALHYDKNADELLVGIDTAGICGDADGNGNPSQTDYYLYLAGGVDQPQFGGGEFFAVCFDFDNDGDGDVIAGIPLGANISQFKVARIVAGVPLSQSFAAFGVDLPEHNGGVLGAPVATCPDMEFSLTDFCSLMDEFGTPGQTSIGVHVFLGSFDDAMIGEDFISGATNDDFLSVPIANISGGMPILNHLQLVDIEVDNGLWKYTSGYTKAGGFIGCYLFSLIDNPNGTFLGAPINMNILVGDGTAASIFVTEFQAPISANACEYFEDDYYAPMGLENLTYYVQVFQFRAVFDPDAPFNFLASNRVIVGPSSYPSLNN